MRFLDKLERRFGHLAVPNVAVVLVAAQIFIYGLILIGRIDFSSLLLMPKAILSAGEWWRMVSFLIAPPHVATTAFSAIFLAFFWYIFWMMSGALETSWGVFRFNVYLLAGIVFTVLGAFAGQLISPGALVVASPYFLYLGVFFAFATLNPNIEFLIFFVIPMKVKWLAWFIAGMTFLGFLFAPSMGDRLAILAPVVNYFLFFKDALRQSVASRQRRAKLSKDQQERADASFHKCNNCGATDKSHPERVFRYKVVEEGTICLCEDCRKAD